MAFYSLKFTVPANTAETAPYETRIPIHGGILHQVNINIPPGHAGLTGCAIDEGLHQIAPSNQNEWFIGDDVNFIYPEYHEIPLDTRELNIRGFNLDTANDHSFVIGLGVMPENVFKEWLNLARILSPMAQDISLLKSFLQPPQPGPG